MSEPIPPFDLYQELEVTAGASAEVIAAAYHALAKRYHPDISGADAERMTRVNIAYEWLSDPVRRSMYDASFSTEERDDRGSARWRTDPNWAYREPRGADQPSWAHPDPVPRSSILDVRGDIAALPALLAQKRNWVAFVLLFVAFVVDAGFFWGFLPAEAENAAVFAFTVILSPEALLVPFIAGMLAPRASYLVGALVGVVDALLVTILFWGPVSVDRNGGSVGSPGPGDIVATFAVSILFSSVAAVVGSLVRRLLQAIVRALR